MKAQDLEYQPKPDVIEEPPPPASGFDFRTHIKNARTGELIRVQPYRRRHIGGQVFMERPVDSGNLWYESNKPAGRWVAGADGIGGTADEKAKHVEYLAPRTGLLRQSDIEDENEILRAELAALKAEKSDKVEEKPQRK